MIRLLLLKCCLLLTTLAMANNVVVKNIEELNAANKKAMPGDSIFLQNGEWNNVTIKLSCNGTQEKPVVFRAQTPGKVLITGHSQLKLGGNYIVVDGLYFTNGYAGDDAVITYRINKDQLANYCRVSNCVINDFNNPKRMDENNWVLFYGKHNWLEHCSFINKTNMGVLLAVVLDDDRSRENFHIISENYFGVRPPLGSNGGEIIRVGVSQHCQFNSNTQITNNFFEHCNGETEIISIKSGKNNVSENIFKESEGSVVLRHGDNNTVSANYFLGNQKPSTGGVRVINKGQTVINNVFYGCRGSSFRSPLAIMNGIVNSPAHRYVQVTDARISNNVFYQCAPMSFCEGSDTERTLPPANVRFEGNTFYNTKDTNIFKAWDDISGIHFEGNKVSTAVRQSLPAGFEKTMVKPQKLVKKSRESKSEYANVDMIGIVEAGMYASTGASWFPKKTSAKPVIPVAVNCATTADIYKQLERKEPVTIKLTGKEYKLDKSLIISKPVWFTGSNNMTVKISTDNLLSAFIITANGNLSLSNLSIDGEGVKASHFIASDSTGYSGHYNLVVRNCIVRNLGRQQSCKTFIYAYKSMIADSIIVRNSSFNNNQADWLIMNSEKDDKGYYNAERIVIHGNDFHDQKGRLLDIYRGGNDESTLGPNLQFSANKLQYCNTTDGTELIRLTGVQVSRITDSQFIYSNEEGVLISYHDGVRADHLFNSIRINSGTIKENKFVRYK